MQIEFAIAL